MKNSLLILLLFFCGINARAQTVSLTDLTSIANLSNGDARTFLMQGKGFKQLYSQEMNSLTIEHFQNVTNGQKETVIIGDGVRTGSGVLLHHVTYTTTQVKYILKLITEATSAGLSLNFQGADQFKNIYLYDNFLYTVFIYINVDNTEGSVVVKQKDYNNN